MSPPKRVLFIGNRHQVLQAVVEHPALELVTVLAARGSVERFTLLNDLDLSPNLFDDTDKKRIFESIQKAKFDILVSNGCPFLLPVSSLRKQHQLFLNVHPSLLPLNRGRHPANGALLNNDKEAGSTLHFMDDKADTGRIIHQAGFSLTDDLDLGLLYHLLFKMEARVFTEGIDLLAGHDWKYEGHAQAGRSTYYTRDEPDRLIDHEGMSTEEILRRIRAFGHVGQGCRLSLADRTLLLFDADSVDSSILQNEFQSEKPGSIVLEYDQKLLIRTTDGLIRIKRFILE
ncbi:MAG: formyltransferase family protein [Candidatus Hydrogenedentota bacterium]